jgi:hypothetical protein
MQLRISEREFHTILAALRYYQVQDPENLPEWTENLATNDGEVPALDEGEIDELCVRINIQ